MFTIRHIEADSGHESLRTAQSVSYDSGDTQSTGHPGVRGVCALGGDADPQYGDNFSSGEIYVMNEGGATVAVYRKLGPIKGFDMERFKRDYPGLSFP